MHTWFHVQLDQKSWTDSSTYVKYMWALRDSYLANSSRSISNFHLILWSAPRMNQFWNSWRIPTEESRLLWNLFWVLEEYHCRLLLCQNSDSKSWNIDRNCFLRPLFHFIFVMFQLFWSEFCHQSRRHRNSSIIPFRILFVKATGSPIITYLGSVNLFD